jgi:hypothetical protein
MGKSPKWDFKEGGHNSKRKKNKKKKTLGVSSTSKFQPNIT